MAQSVVTVTDTNHGLGVGDYVAFSGATSFGGNITAAVINQTGTNMFKSNRFYGRFCRRR